MSHLKRDLLFESHKNLKRLRILAHISKAMVFITAMSGAFVAGLDAGLIYNSFPKMGDFWVPPEILDFDPKWKNFFENSTTVQFDHRILGMSTLTIISSTWIMSRFTPLPKRAKLAASCLMAMALFQVLYCLLHYVLKIGSTILMCEFNFKAN